jgi:hypothetical protein
LYFGVIMSEWQFKLVYYCLFIITISELLPITIVNILINQTTMAAVASRSKTDWAEDEEMEGKFAWKTR